MSRTRYVDSGGARIAYELRGVLRRRRPWLVLIQGDGPGSPRLGSGPGVAAAPVPAGAAGQPGVRAQRPPGRLFTVADMAGDVVAVLDAAGLPAGACTGREPGWHGGPGTGDQAPGAGGRPRPGVHGAGLALCLSDAGPSVRLLVTTARMPAGAARRRHTQNALSGQTVRERPDLVDRLLEQQASRAADPGTLSAQAAAGARYAGRLRQARIRARTLVLHGGADTVVDPRNGRLLACGSPGPRSGSFPSLATCSSGKIRTASPRGNGVSGGPPGSHVSSRA